MQTEIVKETTQSKRVIPVTIRLPVLQYQPQAVPGVKARMGVCYASILDLPAALDGFMHVNPRLPSRTAKGALSGPVVAGILETLRECPEQMAIKNRGITLLADKVEVNGVGLTITLSDPLRHGIIDGGHTYAAIREAIDTMPEDLLKGAFVKLHILEGVESDMVPPIAEGLNRSKQVDDPSLVNLQGQFDIIRIALKGVPGANEIAYHQGDSGSVYISEVLVLLELFNEERWGDKKHPNSLYNRQALGLRYFADDMKVSPEAMKGLINRLPDILWLSDAIRKAIPEAALRNGFRFGQMKDKAGAKAKVKRRRVHLPFINDYADYRVPNGWVYPIMAAFRANLTARGWAVPLKEVLPAVIDDLVRVCVIEHRDNNTRPERLGKRESAYEQCYTKVKLYLATRLFHKATER